jgi:hypothetical protein
MYKISIFTEYPFSFSTTACERECFTYVAAARYVNNSAENMAKFKYLENNWPKCNNEPG